MSLFEIVFGVAVIVLICIVSWQVRIMREICLWIAGQEEKR